MEIIDVVTWKDTAEPEQSDGVVFDDDDEMQSGVVFDDDDFQAGWAQMELGSEGLGDAIDNLFAATDSGTTSMYIDKKLQVVVIPVQLKTKTVKVYLTQDSEYCKLYLADVLGSLPKDVSLMLGEIVWALPRAYPVRNIRLLNKLFYKAQQQNAGQSNMLETLSIRDIMASTTDDSSELNYINSQLTLVDMTTESEFGGHI